MSDLARKARWWPEEWPVWVPDHWWYKLTCLVFGHSPIMDQCGIPDHDYCAWCGKSMPGQGERVSGGSNE